MTGLDCSTAAVALCGRVHRLPGLDLRQGSAEVMPFAEGLFDAVVNVESSHEHDRMDSFLAEVRGSDAYDSLADSRRVCHSAALRKPA